jgi:hypothetical protein
MKDSSENPLLRGEQALTLRAGSPVETTHPYTPPARGLIFIERDAAQRHEKLP